MSLDIKRWLSEYVCDDVMITKEKVVVKEGKFNENEDERRESEKHRKRFLRSGVKTSE